jgi:hypothetical protein
VKKEVSGLIFVIFTILLAAVAMSFASKNKLTGAWKIVEVRTVKSDGRYNSVFPKESQAIFIDDHYNLAGQVILPISVVGSSPIEQSLLVSINPL